MFTQSLILVRVDHCRPLMFSQFNFGSELTIVVLLCFLSFILVLCWPLSSSYVYSEFDFGSELTIVVLLCLLRVWFWFRVEHCHPRMFSQSLILVQIWPLSPSYVFSEFDFGSELTIVVLLCLLWVWFWFTGVEHCHPRMFTQSLILFQSWPLSSSYVYSEFNFGSELTIVVLLCLLRV